MNIQMITGPVVGGVIGLVTNGIAIKMLFRPLKALHIGKYKLPFTPGLIPKERERIARSARKVISGELISSETVCNALISEGVKGNVGKAVDGFFESMFGSEKTIYQELLKFTDEDTLDKIVSGTSAEAANIISKKLRGFSLGKDIVQKALFSAKESNRENGGLKSVVSKLLDDRLLIFLSDFLGKNVDKAVSENASLIVSEVVSGEVSQLFEMKCCDFAKSCLKDKESIKERLLTCYDKAVKNELPHVLKSVNLEKIVEDKILSYDTLEFEKIIFDLMKKELNAIIWLGGLLGFIMGFVFGV
jgi:uncharacterized membrane protein YheB (UPF0754 family)